jgi:hypothetical protein
MVDVPAAGASAIDIQGLKNATSVAQAQQHWSSKATAEAQFGQRNARIDANP